MDYCYPHVKRTANFYALQALTSFHLQEKNKKKQQCIFIKEQSLVEKEIANKGEQRLHVVLGVISTVASGVCRQVTPSTNVAMLITVLICLNAGMKAKPWRCGRALLVISIEIDEG